MTAIEMLKEGRDQFGQELCLSDSYTLDGWDLALREILDFRGKPTERLKELTAVDEAFVMGLVVTLVSEVLGGDDPNTVAVQNDLSVLKDRSAASTERERHHAQAVADLIAGNFTLAASRWNAIGDEYPHDIVATKTAHDVYLHVGDDDRRLRSTSAVLERLNTGDPGYGVAAGQHAFALEEAGHLEEAESYARIALDVDPVDVWALHAIAHVYETQDRQSEAVEFLLESRPSWIERDHLALHLEWHLALRFLAAERFAECLEFFDGYLNGTEHGFGLTDLTSMLWRLELAGCDVGDRWPKLVVKWRNHEQLHTTGFLDLHAALAFSACPEDSGARDFWTGLDQCHRAGISENDQTFAEVVRPLATAVREHRAGKHTEAFSIFQSVAAATHRVGGSHVQRDLFVQTAAASQSRANLTSIES